MDQSEILRKAGGTVCPCDYGCSETVARQKLEIAKARYPDKPYCLVSKWIWVDFILKSSLETFIEDGVPIETILLAGEIIEDSAGREFSLLKTSPLVEFSDSAVFLTMNTIYLLVGSGVRVEKEIEMLIVNIPINVNCL